MGDMDIMSLFYVGNSEKHKKNGIKENDIIVTVKAFNYYETLMLFIKKYKFTNGYAASLYFTLYFVNQNFRNYILESVNPSLKNIILRGSESLLYKDINYMQKIESIPITIPYTEGISYFFDTQLYYENNTYIFGGYYIDKVTNRKVVSSDLYCVCNNDDRYEQLENKISTITLNKFTINQAGFAIERYNCGLVLFLNYIIIFGGFNSNDEPLVDAYSMNLDSVNKMWHRFGNLPRNFQNMNLINKITIDYSRHSIILFDSDNGNVWELVLLENINNQQVLNYDNWQNITNLSNLIYNPCLSYMGYGNIVITGIVSDPNNPENYKQLGWIYYRKHDDDNDYNRINKINVSHWETFDIINEQLFYVIGNYYDNFSEGLILITNTMNNDIQYVSIRTVNSAIKFYKKMILLKTLKTLDEFVLHDYKTMYEQKIKTLINRINRPTDMDLISNNIIMMRNELKHYKLAMLPLLKNYDESLYLTPKTREYIRLLSNQFTNIRNLEKEQITNFEQIDNDIKMMEF